MSKDNVYELLREQYRKERLTDISLALIAANEQNDQAQFIEYLKTSSSERTADQLRDCCVKCGYDTAELVQFFKSEDKLVMTQLEKHL